MTERETHVDRVKRCHKARRLRAVLPGRSPHLTLVQVFRRDLCWDKKKCVTAKTSSEWRLRACLHGVGDPGLVGLVSFVSRSGGRKTKETCSTRPGSPTTCKQGLSGPWQTQENYFFHRGEKNWYRCEQTYKLTAMNNFQVFPRRIERQ